MNKEEQEKRAKLNRYNFQEGKLAGRQEVLDKLQAIFSDFDRFGAGNYWALRNQINDLFPPSKGGE